jgi:hypothetical protein
LARNECEVGRSARLHYSRLHLKGQLGCGVGVVSRRFGAGLLAFVIAAPAAILADDDFPLAGVYTKDQACTGAAAKRKDLRVTITTHKIESSLGVCSILNRRRDGNTFALHVECTIPGDQVILGDVTFKIRDPAIVDFDDQDHTSPAVLYRCPGK